MVKHTPKHLFLSSLRKLMGSRHQDSLDKRIFRIAVFVAFATSLVGAIMSEIAKLAFSTVIVGVFVTIVYGIFFVAIRSRKITESIKVTFIFLTILFINYFWFALSGANGVIPLIYIFASSVFASFLKSRRRVLIITTIQVINIGGLFALHWTKPELITPYPDDNARFIELIILSGLSILLNSIVVFYLKQNYVRERIKLNKKNDKLIDSEIELMRKNKELENVNKRLSVAKELAEESSQAKSEFLSMMSHEIRTPLNAVIGMSHILMMENKQQEQLDNLRTLKFSAENLLVIINDILDFSKIEAGKIELENADFNLEKTIRSILHGLKYKAEENNVKLAVELDKNLPEIMVGDPTRIGQILSNLLSNAVKFTKNGTVTAKVNIREKGPNNIRFECQVIDTGIGIPKDKQRKIFESFSQATSKTSRKYGGTGLGLAITKRLLQLMDSRIELHSEPGKGSTFSFSLQLPYHTQSRSESLTNDFGLQDFRSLAGFRVLMAEDNRINVKVASTFLEKWDLEYQVAENGEELLKLLESDPDFDLVLMDLQMPVMDGFEATRQIRSNPKEEISGLPVIALTASAMLDMQDKAFKVGMTDYVSKPFNPNELYQKITKYLNSNQRRVSQIA